MADSKAKGAEDAASEAEEAEKRKKLEDRQNEISKAQPTVGDPQQPDSRAVLTDYSSPELAKVQSGRLGTDPELALGNLAHARRARSTAAQIAPPAPLKLRISVASTGNGSVAITTAGQAPSARSSPSLPPAGQVLSRLRPKPTPAPPRPGAFLFGSCFGSSPPSSPPSKLPPPQLLLRKPTSPPTRLVTSDSAKPILPPAEVQNKAPVELDSITNTPIATSPIATSETSASAIPRSPSCRCSIPTIEAENAAKIEQTLPLDPGATASASASMSKAENDPGISSGQQVLNAEAEELIAAVKRADEESRQPSPESRPSAIEGSRQSAAGVSPIRGLRPSHRGLRSPGRRPRGDFANYDPGPSRTRKSPYQRRSRSPHNYDYEPQYTAKGVERLFDSIIGRDPDLLRQSEQAQTSQAPKRFHRKPRTTNLRGVSHSPTWAEQDLRERETEDDGQHQNPRDPTQNNPAEPSGSRGHTFSDLSDLPGARMMRDDQEYSGRADHPREASGGRGHTFSGLSDLPILAAGANMIIDDQEYPGEIHPDETGDGFPDVFADAFIPTQKERDARLLASDIRWKKKDVYREAKEKNRDPRRRGHADPSFIPRPGDIIIRARKRAGLRLTDFYYYDNENYMEPGDQILRAKFDYLPPMDKMYLWCRLYVYSANNSYTFLDSTSESIGKFGITALESGIDARNPNSGNFFKGN